MTTSSARRSRRSARAALAVLGLTLLGAACGSSSHHAAAGPPSTPAPRATTTTTTAPVVDPADNGQEAAILAAYRGSLADFNKVEDTDPVDPNNPLLSDSMAGSKLQTVQSALSNLAKKNQVAEGQLQSLHASVSKFNGTEAVVESCEIDKTAVADAKTHKVLMPPSNATELVNELVTLDSNGTWKVTEGSQVSPGCS